MTSSTPEVCHPDPVRVNLPRSPGGRTAHLPTSERDLVAGSLLRVSTHPREDTYTGTLLVGYAVAAVVNIAAQAAGIGFFTAITKPFLMLLLFCWAWQVLPGPRPRAGVYLLIGILFAWLGDVLLMGASSDAQGNLFFMLGIGGFFGMQVCYILGFLAIGGRHLLRAAPLLVVPFVAYWALMNWVMDPGVMRIPVLLYSIVLVGMSVAALDLVPRLPRAQGWRVFIGSVLFVISDSFIAASAFADLHLGNWEGVIVMTTYVIAQYLIVTGFARALVLRDQGAGQDLLRPAPATA
jgi:uncharacterized membrane protein YhhN